MGTMATQTLSVRAMEDKRIEVEKLVQMLQHDLEKPQLPSSQHVEILTKLKVHGRDLRGSDAIYSDQGFETVCKYAFASADVGTSQEALRIVANALLLQPALRSKLVGLAVSETLVTIYDRGSDDDEFLGGRILFLLTYGTKADFATMLQTHGLADAMLSHLKRHGEQSTNSTKGLGPMGTMALSETLKLLFNLANAIPAEISRLSVAVPSIFEILVHMEIQPMPLEPPLSTVINALAILNFSPVEGTLTASRSQLQLEEVASKLVQILDSVVSKYKATQLDTAGIPLLTVIRKLYEIASTNAKMVLQKALLPDDSERDLPLGQSTSLASKLLRLTSSPGLSTLPESISALMFELSDKDASTFVKNIGYGYAAGYLMTHKIPIPENAKATQDGKDANQIPINPVTGQRLDKETASDAVEMTQEEKEREAERLFVLFERLRATGVVDVKNPVQEAMEKGRFEELSDSDADPD